MASTIIHMCVAKKVNEKLNMDIRLLSLGSIAPDSGKYFTGNKDMAHFVKDNPYIPVMEDFLNKYKDCLDSPFEMGYYIHLLTDKYWFGDFIEEKMVKYNSKFNNTLVREEILNVIYKDYSILNKSFISLYLPYIDVFFNKLSNFSSNLSEIPCNKLGEFVLGMKDIIFDDVSGDCEILKYDEVCKFIDECSDLILLDIKRDLGVFYGRKLQ